MAAEDLYLKSGEIPDDIKKKYGIENVVDTQQDVQEPALKVQNLQENTQNANENVQPKQDYYQETMNKLVPEMPDYNYDFSGAGNQYKENESIKRSKMYRTYMATNAEKLEQAKEISSHIGISVESITADPKSFEKAVEIDNRYRKLLALAPTDEKAFVLDDLYEEYPALRDLKSGTDGAIALHNIENVKRIQNIADAGKGLDSRKLTREYGAISLAAYEGKTLTEAQQKRLADINVERAQMMRYAPDFWANPATAIAYGTLEQGSMMAEQLAKSQVYAIPMAGIVGAGVTAVSGPVAGAAAAKLVWGMATKYGTGVEMFKETVGGYYLDYKGYTDENGKQLLTDDEARLAATLAAAGEAIIEVSNFDEIVGVLKGTPVKEEAKEILGKIVADAADKASIKAQLGYYMKNRFGKAAVAGLSEITEEGKQAVYTDLVHNAVAYLKPNGNLKPMSIGEIAEDAFDNMVEAIPSVIGMTGAGHVASSSKYVNKLADMLSERDADIEAAQKTAGGINMLEQLNEDMKNSDLAKKSPEIYNQLVTSSLKGTQYENVVVDTELLLKDKEGGEIFYQLAAAAGITEEEAQSSDSIHRMLSVPVSKYMEVAQNDAVREKLRKYVSFGTEDDCFARIQKDAKEYKANLDKQLAEDYQKTADTIDSWVKDNVEGEQEQAVMAQILFEYDNPKDGHKAIKQEYQAKLDALINPIVNDMRKGMKQGVGWYNTDDDYNIIGNEQGTDAHLGGAVRVSNNDRWYSEYYRQNKKAPSEKEMRQIARDALMGDNPYGVFTDMEGLTGAERMAGDAYYRDKIETYESVLDTLGKLEGVVQSFDTSDLKAMEELSAEGMECYKAVKDALITKKGNVKTAAVASAIVVAHHYDTLAGYYKKMGQNVTAKQLMDKRFSFSDKVGAGDVLMQQGAEVNAEEQLRKDEERFAANVDKMTYDTAEAGKPIKVMLTPPLYGALGIPMLPIEVTYGNLFKIYKGKHVDDMNPDIVKKLPRALANPVMILKTYKLKNKGKRIVVVTDLVSQPKDGRPAAPVIATIELKGVSHDGAYKINELITSFGKTDRFTKLPRFDYFVDEAKDGNVLYCNMKKATDLATSFGSYTSTDPLSGDQFLNIVTQNNPKVKTENDIQNEIYMQRAWHGSPHKFDKFNLQAIGTGEGAQVHGYGLYFALDRDVAEAYKERLSRENHHPVTAKVGDLSLELKEGEMKASVNGETTTDKDIINALYDIKNTMYKDSVNDLNVDIVKAIKEVEGFAAHWKTLLPEDTSSRAYRNIKRETEFYLSAAEGYRKLQQNGATISASQKANIPTLYEVEIPDADVMMDEDAYLDEQPLSVQEAIQELLGDDVDYDLTGRKIYKQLTKKFGSPMAASVALNEHGVKGILYEGRREGSCAVVFNDEAIDTVERYNQSADRSALNQQAAQSQGQVEVRNNGMHIITLFESADQSTFMHEMAHVFYDDLRDLANYENAPEQVKRDWKNLQLWTAWKDGQLEEYKGTATYNEFKELDAAIRQAQETGKSIYQNQELPLQSLLNHWAQERFARGFEVYLEEGKAPTKALQSAFAKFKNWLTKIYKAVTGAGAKPSKEVKEIMDRMLATQVEIDNSIERAKIEAFQKQGLFDYLDGTSQDMWARNMEKIKEDVAAKVQKVAYRDMTIQAKEEREEKLKAEREAAYERISQEPVFVAYQFLKTNPSLNVSDVVESCTDMTVEEYVTELKARGGSLEAAVDNYMEEYEAQLEKPTKAEIRAAAEKAINNSYYTKLANAFEIQALEQYARDEVRLAKKLAGIKAKDEAERKKEEAAVRKLDKEQRKQEERDRNVRALSAETKRNEKLEKEIRELDAKILDLKSQIHAMKTNEKRNKDMRLDEVKSQMQNRVFEAIEKYEYKKKELREEQKKYRAWQDEEGRGKRIYRDALDKYIQKIEKYAEQKMAVLPIKDATNVAMWKKMADEYSDTSLTLFARGEYDLAARQKRIAFFYRHMAHLAEKNKAKVESRVKILEGHSRTMMKEKNVTANDRYLYNHLMYCFGLANKDALVPPTFTAWENVLVTYNENLELSYVDQDGNIDLPNWLTSAMGNREDGRYKDGYIDLNMDEMQLLFNVMQNIYKVGREAKNLKTAKDIHGNTVTVEDAVANIVSEAMNNVALKMDRDTTGAENISDWDNLCAKANYAHVQLLKPETIMRQLGDNAMKYIYNPIKLAADNEMIETEALAAKVRGITEAWEDGLLEVYTNMTAEERNNLSPEKATAKALKELRTKKQYKLGTSNLTKENVIALALNWGTELNRKRVLDGFNVTPSQVEKVLAELNAADWQMVINIWELFDDYWPRLVEVEANCSGVVMEKQQALPFSVMDKSGFTYNIKGGYYPIKYNLAKEGDIGNKVGDEAKRVQMSDQSRLGMGMGHNKERKEDVKRKIRLDFGVFSEVISENIHQIAMREAIRDVNRVVRDKGFEEFIKASYGQAALNMLQNWVLDCWKKEPQVKGMLDTVARWFREKQTTAALGYRFTTALLNICNISYVFDYLGPVRAVSALQTFYAHPQEQYAFALEKSVFLRDRAETMDRDMGDVLKRQKTNPGTGFVDWANSKAFSLITATDLMLACPLWVSEYQRAYQEAMDKKLNPEQAEREAVLAGDAGVRRVFGSGLIQDQANIQKGSEFSKLFTMYYSFFSVVHNALMMKVFESRQQYRKSVKEVLNEDGTVKGMERDYKEAAKALVPIATGIIFWMIIPAAMETGIRALASGDDKDKEAKNLAKKTLTTIAGTAVGGIPYARDIVPAFLEWYMGGRYYGMGGTPMGDVADKAQRVLSSVKSGKKTKFDIARGVADLLSTTTGLSKTMLDAMVSAAQFVDHGKLTTDDILHYMWAIAFDKNPDKKK